MQEITLKHESFLLNKLAIKKYPVKNLPRRCVSGVLLHRYTFEFPNAFDFQSFLL